MGGAVSSGRDNNELVDNLMSGNYIRTRAVERVFRVLDRADYMSAEARDQAYKDLAWRNGPLHLSAPCIYSEVMEALELKPGLSFLNVGSGTGYLSTLVGLIIGSSGTSHGVEAIPFVFEYANKKLAQFIENSITLDEFDFCIPKYYTGNGLCLAPTHMYDRVYCGAGVLAKYENYFKQFIKVGGVLVMPLSDTLVQMRRVSESHWTRRNLLNVSFARLRDPAKDELDDLIKLDELSPAPLQMLSRAAIRSALRDGVLSRSPELREPPPAPPPAPRAGPRRICIPYEATSEDEELSELHGLDEAGGAHEMNALLSLVLSMGQNRAAGSLRFEHDDEHAQDEQQLGELFALDREEDEQDAVPDGGIIFFDVGVRAAMRARRRGRARPPQNERDADTSAEPNAEQNAERNPEPDAERNAEPDERVRRSRRSPPNETASSSKDSSADTSVAPNSSDTQGTSDTVSTPEDGPASTSEAPKKPEPKDNKTERPRAPPRRSFPPKPSLWSDLSSSEDDAAQVKDSKRQKLDSGIGEGTASSGASPDNKTSPVYSSNTDDDDEVDTDMPWAGSECASSGSGADSDHMDESESDEAPPVPPRARPPCPSYKRCKRIAQAASRRRGVRRAWCSRRARAEAGRARSESESEPEAGDPRRVNLSLAMKRAIKELPLPHALKKYCNYGRCYQI